MSLMSPPLSARAREGQFVGDLATLFRRYRVRTGTPDCLMALAPQLQANNSLRGDLFALSGTAEHDPSIGGAGCNGAADRDADRRIVDRGIAVRAVIVHCVPERCQCLLHVFLEREARVIGADRNSHSERIILWVRGSP